MARQDLEKRSFEWGGRSFEYSVRRSQRARRASIHVSWKKGVEVVLPWRASERSVDSFLYEKREWIVQRIAEIEEIKTEIPRRQLVSGAVVPVMDSYLYLKINVEPGRKKSFAREVEGQIVVRVADVAQVRQVLVHWYRKEAKRVFVDMADELADLIGVRVTNVSIREQATQWGSCGRGGRLAFNWRLLLAPEKMARYVAAHEVAHIKQSNHSRAFWETVAFLDPEYKTHRMWLKKNEHRLVL